MRKINRCLEEEMVSANKERKTMQIIKENKRITVNEEN